MVKKMIWISSVLLVTALLSQPVLGDQKEQAEGPWERFSFNLGGFITSLNSEVRIGVEQLGAGIVVDVEDALGLDSSA